MFVERNGRRENAPPVAASCGSWLNFLVPRLSSTRIEDGQMTQVRMAETQERSVPARALWPWAVFTVALATGLVLFFVYPPR
jgi:hypothetical protein